MRVTTTTQANGNVVGRCATKQRTVKGGSEKNLNHAHAEAAKQVSRAAGVVDLPLSCEQVSKDRLVWQF